MHAGMSLSMMGQIGHQAGKITLFRVSGAVRAYIGNLQIVSKIRHQLHQWFLSKNVLCRKNSWKTAPFSHVDQSLPTT